jgi:hypothetical protein
MRVDLGWFGAVLLLTLLVVTTFVPITPGTPFNYDEADYMFAGTRGFLANYLDRPSQSLVEFISKGRELSQNRQERVSMSEYIRSTGDITFYRHYHGPVFAYWIAALHAVGVTSEHTYRAAEFIVHTIDAIVIFWMFRLVFPEFGALPAFLAAAVFVTNRTALVTATSITQHLAFAFLAIVALFVLAQYIRTRQLRWWYATTALLALAFASVEISVILIGVVVLTVGILQWRDGWREIFLLIAKGALSFMVALIAVWPPGVLRLGALKGYLYLAYMTIYRKTFTPIGPFDLWGFKLKTYPLEFVPLLVALFAATLYFPRLKCRAAMLPFVLYAWAFIAATMVITLPYTYYHCSLPMCLAVITGLIFAELRRVRPAVAYTGLIAVLICGILSAAGFRRELTAEASSPSVSANVVRYIRTQDRPADVVFAPRVMIPTLHYYLPAQPAIGFDRNPNVADVAAQSADATPGAEVVCEQRTCAALEQLWPAPLVVHKEQLGRTEDTGEGIWAYQLHR